MAQAVKISHIKAIRKIRHLQHTASQHGSSGALDQFEYWMKKAMAKKHDLAKSMGLIPAGVRGSAVYVSIDEKNMVTVSY